MNDKVKQPTQAEIEAQNARPIVLTLTMGKVNYILNQLAQLPYEKAYQPIADIQQMVMAQLQEQPVVTPDTATPEAATPEASTQPVEKPSEAA